MSFAGDAGEIAERAVRSRAQPSRLLAVARALLLVIWIVLMVSLFYVVVVTAKHRIPGLLMTFHGGVARLFGMRIHMRGELVTGRPVLYVSNHASYLDVFVLGARVPASFIAKAEVAGWPVFGSLAKFQNTLFFERNTRRAADQIGVMRDHLRQRSNLILFPEGTSTPGDQVQPFRSSLFAAIEDGQIQPLTVVYAKYAGEPMTQAERDRYAWYLPMAFAPHFFSALGLAGSDVYIICHKPVRPGDFPDRKRCAAYCEGQVRDGLESILNTV